MCKYCEYLEKFKPRKGYSKHLEKVSDEALDRMGIKKIYGKFFDKVRNPSIVLTLREDNIELPCTMDMEIYINSNGKFYYKGSYSHYSASDRYYNSWDSDLGNGISSPSFKDKDTGFKFCPMCGRKLVK